MKSNESKLKYLIAGSELEKTNKEWVSGTFEVKDILRIKFTIYDLGADFIYIRHGDLACTYWFTDVKIEDNTDGCELSFYDNNNVFLGMVFLKNIYLEVGDVEVIE